jgi:RHS repeat-associated protein
VNNPFRYTGQYQDSESGLYYLRARYYDPATQQFLSRDPLANLTGTAYAYAGGSPVNGVDPSGLANKWAEGVKLRPQYATGFHPAAPAVGTQSAPVVRFG